ncbi:hypothetical protein MAC_06813 [Metarhizium acridum CQMa 102]|uniref:Uncharacterized protein n=1 Tax=Metarhizium acridum (strain CQMa 102) TaxID=655827 RepID=E9EAB4_METAQ|nr:uncharacterized protein MAC_06813 [Metarhizium acridum CQMa 102]EFY87135.1 hypothetical protein MAC_06813 [Metarhizium acridum CQMa 102]
MLTKDLVDIKHPPIDSKDKDSMSALATCNDDDDDELAGVGTPETALSSSVLELATGPPEYRADERSIAHCSKASVN